jgi:alkylation response protein AidB-like acyl-CoA dehydrogenase
VLIIPAELEGVKTTRMKTQGWWMSSTALVAFDNVRVPRRYLVGKEGQGFKYIMRNFNHERFVLAAMANRYARVMMEEAIKYGRTRRTFNKRLMDHQVLRHKVAEMARQVEACHALLEQVAYNMKVCIEEGKDDHHLAGMIALTKVSCTRCMDLCAREATQIIGGAACVRGGPGATVERLYREVRINAIGGGSEEILLELAMSRAKL